MGGRERGGREMEKNESEKRKGKMFKTRIRNVENWKNGK